MSGDLIGIFLEKVGLRKLSWDDQVRTALRPITDITIDMSPSRAADTSAWAFAALERINQQSKEKIITAIDSNPEVAAATADKMLTNIHNLRMQGVQYEAKDKELMILSNSNRLVEELNIPAERHRINSWQRNIVDEFKEKYKYKYHGEDHFSTASHLVVAVKLLEIANPGK